MWLFALKVLKPEVKPCQSHILDVNQEIRKLQNFEKISDIKHSLLNQNNATIVETLLFGFFWSSLGHFRGDSLTNPVIIKSVIFSLNPGSAGTS